MAGDGGRRREKVGECLSGTETAASWGGKVLARTLENWDGKAGGASQGLRFPWEGKRPLRMGDGGKPKTASQSGHVWSFPLALVESTLALPQQHQSLLHVSESRQ